MPEAKKKIETKKIKLDMRSRGGRRALEKLLADGWTIADKREKSILEWGYKTEYLLTR